ncbi:hypothetical protein L1887_31325 [Cichorium endivia]|nr:hypothetical protein L1887_31325 [Cichorium endivia]
MERGPRYKAYADLREARLRMKLMNSSPPLPPENQDSINNPTPLKKEVKFKGQKSFRATATSRRKVSCVSQSVPKLSSTSRKDDRKPVLTSVVEKSVTPPAKSSLKFYENNSKLAGSNSWVPAEKKRNGLFTAIRSSRRAVQTWMK